MWQKKIENKNMVEKIIFYEFGGRYKKCPNGLNAPGAVPRSSALYLFIFLVGGKNSHLISFTKNQKPL